MVVSFLIISSTKHENKFLRYYQSNHDFDDIDSSFQSKSTFLYLNNLHYILLHASKIKARMILCFTQIIERSRTTMFYYYIKRWHSNSFLHKKFGNQVHNFLLFCKLIRAIWLQISIIFLGFIDIKYFILNKNRYISFQLGKLIIIEQKGQICNFILSSLQRYSF